MAEYDWIISDDFKSRITSAVASSAGRAGMQQYETAIVDTLVEKATQRRAANEATELRKTAAARRTIQDALASVETLVEQASQIAAREGRTTVAKNHIDAAYDQLYCRCWPFC